MNRKIIRVFFLKWHRNLGALSALVFVFIAITGILLNHGNTLRLDHNKVQWSWLSSYYGLGDAQKLRSFLVGKEGIWLSQIQGDLYFGKQSTSSCAGVFIGAVAVDGVVYAQCGNSTHLITLTGQLIESITSPLGFNQIGVLGEDIIARCKGEVLSSASDLCEKQQYYVFSDDSAGWVQKKIQRAQGARWSALSEPPHTILEYLNSINPVAGITWERLLLDVHSGRVFGSLGVLFVDAMAFLLIFSALSGWWLWFTRSSKAKKRR